MTANQRVNMNVSGGGKLARYYIAASFSKDNGNLKSNSMNGFDNNINLRSYQLRSNININLTKTTEAVVRLSGTFDDYRGPLDGGDVMYKKIVRSNPVLFPAYYPSERHYCMGCHCPECMSNKYSDTFPPRCGL